jgi:hypothetical protein
MGVHWSWGFGNENGTALTAMGFTVDTNTGYTGATQDYTFTYSGDISNRYSLYMRGNGVNFKTPAVAFVNKGWIAFAMLNSDGNCYDSYSPNPIQVTATAGSTNSIYLSFNNDCSLDLVVGNVFKATGAVVNWNQTWNYVALKYDMSTTTWSGTVYINGAEYISAQTETDTVATAGYFGSSGLPHSTRSRLGQIIVWDDLADPGEEIRYVTRLTGSSDDSTFTSGSWSPSTGTDDYAVVGSPFDSSTYTEEATPSNGDCVTIRSLSISGSLGITPSVINGITLHGNSAGLAQTARVRIGSGTPTFTAGSTETIASSTYTFATATTQPEDGNPWAASSSVDLQYEVVTS